MQYKKMKEKMVEYNWDDGFDFPKEIVTDPNCDLALALEVFYSADGYRFLQDYPEMPQGNPEWIGFIKILLQDIIDDKYKKTKNHYEIDLTKVQKYKLS